MKDLKRALIKYLIKKFNDGITLSETEFALLKYLDNKKLD